MASHRPGLHEPAGSISTKVSEEGWPRCRGAGATRQGGTVVAQRKHCHGIGSAGNQADAGVDRLDAGVAEAMFLGRLDVRRVVRGGFGHADEASQAAAAGPPTALCSNSMARQGGFGGFRRTQRAPAILVAASCRPPRRALFRASRRGPVQGVGGPGEDVEGIHALFGAGAVRGDDLGDPWASVGADPLE